MSGHNERNHNLDMYPNTSASSHEWTWLADGPTDVRTSINRLYVMSGHNERNHNSDMHLNILGSSHGSPLDHPIIVSNYTKKMFWIWICIVLSSEGEAQYNRMVSESKTTGPKIKEYMWAKSIEISTDQNIPPNGWRSWIFSLLWSLQSNKAVEPPSLEAEALPAQKKCTLVNYIYSESTHLNL